MRSVSPRQLSDVAERLRDMASLGLVVLGLLLGLLLGGVVVWIVLQQRFAAQRAVDAAAARAAMENAVRQSAERAVAAEEHARAVFAARQDALVAQLREQAATER